MYAMPLTSSRNTGHHLRGHHLQAGRAAGQGSKACAGASAQAHAQRAPKPTQHSCQVCMTCCAQHPLTQVSGARLSTILMRLPYLPFADAVVCENGGSRRSAHHAAAGQLPAYHGPCPPCTAHAATCPAHVCHLTLQRKARHRKAALSPPPPSAPGGRIFYPGSHLPTGAERNTSPRACTRP